MLGRTTAAVYKKRRALDIDPRVIALAGMPRNRVRVKQ